MLKYEPIVCIYLDDKCMCIGDFVLWGHMLLHSLAGASDGQQDECVGQEDDSAGYNVAEEEEADDVAHGCGAFTGCVPVDAAGCSIRLSPVLSPAWQGTNSEDPSVAPDPSDQHVGVAVRKLVTCNKEEADRGRGGESWGSDYWQMST